MKFELRYPTEIIFGRGTFEQIGKKSSEYGDRAFLVTGRSAMHKTGIIDKSIALLNESGFRDVYLYDQAEHDPSVETVDRGTQLARSGGYNVVIGIGGGSAIDTAKTIACLVRNEGSAADYQSGRKIERAGIPFIALPTTAGTGAEITKNSVITNRSKKIKQSIRSPFMIAKVAIVDPLLTVTMPPNVTSATGMDALTQAIEVCVSRAANPVGDALGLHSISLISDNLVKAFEDGSDLDARENMALGSLLGAMAFANASLGAVHGLAHPVGALFDVPHGVACALLLPHVMEYNIPVRTAQFSKIAQTMGNDVAKAKSDEESARMSVNTVKGLLEKLQIPQHLGEFGVTEKDIDLIIQSARGSSLDSNPRPVTPESLRDILMSVL